MNGTVRAAIALLIAVAGTFGALAVACGDDDDKGGVEVIDGDASAEPDPEADPDPEASAEPITPAPKPDAATQLNVSLAEYEITLSTNTVTAGEVYFLVQNAGPEEAHEFAVIKTELAADALPVEDGKVPEDEVDVLDEIEPFAVGATGSLTLDLEPGSYVLICNIAEETEGAIESHYTNGMHTALTVE
jgi:uncharacterized cupredoxin-like copper-binding protein